MSGAPATSVEHAVAHPPLSVAITTIGVMAIAMVGSSISSQLVDLDIADIAGAFSVSADQASWIACVATMAEVAGIPIAAILARALSLRRVALCIAFVFAICASASLLVADEEPLVVLLPAAGSEFALIPPDNATGNFTKIVRRFTVRIRFNARDANAALARPGRSVETAVAVSTPDNATPTEQGNRVGCSFDPSKDMVERTLTKLPEHPGLGRARPQGTSGMEVPISPPR